MKKNTIIALVAAASLMATAPLLAKSESKHYRAQQSESVTAIVNQKIDINTASASQLAALKHIGTKKAAAIVAYRNANGNFKSIDDLDNVKGISQRIIDVNKALLSLSQ